MMSRYQDREKAEESYCCVLVFLLLVIFVYMFVWFVYLHGVYFLLPVSIIPLYPTHTANINNPVIQYVNRTLYRVLGSTHSKEKETLFLAHFDPELVHIDSAYS